MLVRRMGLMGRAWTVSIVAAVGTLVVPPVATRACDSTGGQHGVDPRGHRPPPVVVEWDVEGIAPNCLTMVDRSIEAVVHLEYAVAQDAVCDEPVVPDDHSHEFIAFCRDREMQAYLPNWILVADLASYEDIVAPADPAWNAVLETDPAWADCWSPLDDGGKRPIARVVAEQGIDWDTSLLPPGSYVVYGYAYYPPYNRWYERPGVFKLHDGDAAAVGPAVDFTATDTTPYRDDPIEIRGCVDAIEGTQLVVSWSLASLEVPEWHPIVTVEVEGTEFVASFLPPPTTWGEVTILRVEAIDPMQRRDTSYFHDYVHVIDEERPRDPPDASDTIGDDGDSTSAPDAKELGGENGCGCASSPPPRWSGGMLGLFMLLGLAARPRPARRGRDGYRVPGSRSPRAPITNPMATGNP